MEKQTSLLNEKEEKNIPVFTEEKENDTKQPVNTKKERIANMVGNFASAAAGAVAGAAAMGFAHPGQPVEETLAEAEEIAEEQPQEEQPAASHAYSFNKPVESHAETSPENDAKDEEPIFVIVDNESPSYELKELSVESDMAENTDTASDDILFISATPVVQSHGNFTAEFSETYFPDNHSYGDLFAQESTSTPDENFTSYES